MTLANLKLRLEIEKGRENAEAVKLLEERIERRIAKYKTMGKVVEEDKVEVKEEEKETKSKEKK